MTEPDVALTDYLLTLECAVFAALIARQKTENSDVRFWFSAFFAATALASLAGGSVHGFFLDSETLGYRILWPLSLLAIGFASLAAWCAGTRTIFARGMARILILFAALGFAGYCLVVVTLIDEFWVALVGYIPASVLLLAAFLRDAVRHRTTAPILASLGLVLTFAGGAAQHFRYSVHPIYLSHNALYHVILAGALVLIFIGARWQVWVRRVPARS